MERIRFTIILLPGALNVKTDSVREYSDANKQKVASSQKSEKNISEPTWTQNPPEPTCQKSCSVNRQYLW